jgi:phosphoglycerate kinase
MKEYNTLDDFNVENKTVLLRVDFNLPLDKKTLEILDTTRIKLVLPTIQELLEKKAKIVILAHQGRQGSWDFISLDKHAKALENLIKKQVIFVDDVCEKKAQDAIKNLQNNQILFLDNVRKLSEETEKKSAEDHAKSKLVQNLSPLIDIFVNDAFAAAHRAQCSLIGFTAVLPSAAGRLVQKELTTLEKVVKKPEKPCVFLFGGAKFSDLIVTIEQILKNKTADKIILTGLPANAFLKSQGYDLGEINESTLLEEASTEQFNQIKNIYSKYKQHICLPIDFAISQNDTRMEISLNDLPTTQNLFDIGEKTINKFIDILSSAKTVFLSGPCGVFENPLFQKGTKKIFEFVAQSDVFSVAGGGHTVASIETLNLRDKISHISTGGGSLEKFLMGEQLVVIEALKKAKLNQLATVK